MRLGVNIDHVATLRQARKGIEPELALAALIAEKSGADSIVVHLREDRRHIQDEDVFILKEILSVPLNLEMSFASEIVKIALKLKPQRATLVPEKRKELTTEGGLDVRGNFHKISSVVEKLNNAGIKVSLFIDPDKKQIFAAKDCGVRMVEIHTGRYANAKTQKEEDKFFNEIRLAASLANSLGFKVFAGHGLNYTNVLRILKIKEIEELNIGHSIISYALFCGLGQAVQEMKRLIVRR